MFIVLKLTASLTKCCGLGVLAVVGTISNGASGAVVLSNATATYSQTAPFGSFPVSQTIDGIFASPNGWAIHPNEGDQIAVYEIATNPAGPFGALFTFIMTQN